MYTKNNIYNDNIKQEVFAVDGTEIGLLKTSNLMDNNFRSNKGKSITALNICIYNVTNHKKINLKNLSCELGKL